jgi:Predicted membrane protein
VRPDDGTASGAVVDIAVRGVVLFLFVYLLTRVIGRRELSSLQPFDLILLIVLGDLIQQGLTQDDYSVTGAIIAVATIAALQVVTSWSAFRFPWLRRVLDGHPIVLVEDGKVIEKNLRRERLTKDDLAEQARSNQIASLDEVQWAIFEPSGTISFLEKKQ